MSSPSHNQRPSAKESSPHTTTRSTPKPSPSPSHKPPASTPGPHSISSSARSSFSFPLHPSDIPSPPSLVPSTPVRPTATITTTIHPESTFSVPFSVPVTDPLGASKGFSTPPFVTSLFTTESNGMTVVVTHIVANPTNVVTGTSTRSSFFEDQGKTAGVFLVVGVVVAALAFGLFFCIRRRLRKNRQREWLATIPPRQDEDPFADPRPLSLVRETSRPTNRSSIWDSRRVPVPEYFASDMPIPSQPPLPPVPPLQPAPVFQPSMPPPPPPPPPPPRNPNHKLSMKIVPVRRDDFKDEPLEHSPIGVAITSDKREFNRSRTSLMSSPSIYPQSLPGGDDEDASSFYEMEMKKHVQPQQKPHVTFPASVRKSNELYDSARSKLQARAMMLTPPLTDDSSTPPSPDFDKTKMVLPPQSSVFQKPTLLNVRRRETYGHL